MDDTRSLLATEDILGSRDLVYAPLIAMADILAAGLLLAGWAVLIIVGTGRRAQLLTLTGLSLLAVVAFSVQFQHSETIDLITVVTD